MTVLWMAAVASLVALCELGRRRLPARDRGTGGARRLCWYAAAGLLALIGVPQLVALAQHSLWAQALQFGLLAFAVAPLVVLGSAWALPGSLRRPGLAALPTGGGAGVAALACFVAVTVGWRTAPAVDAAASGRGWVALETITLIAGTWWLWSVLLATSPPLASLPRPWRFVLALAATWSVWVFAYVVGFSAHPFYPAYSAGAQDGSQQLVVAVLMTTSAIALCPVLFVNLVRWLGADQAAAEAEMASFRLPSHVEPQERG